jgi:hypothetical protein
MTHERQANIDNDPGDSEKDGLKGMEADKALSVVGLNHEKDNGWNDGEIGQSAGYIIGESGAGGCQGVGSLCCAGSTLGTSYALRDLRSAGWTERHEASFEMTGKLTERALWRNR